MVRSEHGLTLRRNLHSSEAIEGVQRHMDYSVSSKYPFLFGAGDAKAEKEGTEKVNSRLYKGFKDTSVNFKNKSVLFLCFLRLFAFLLDFKW